MIGFRTIVVAAVALSSAMFAVQSAEGAGIKRQLYCFASAGIALPLVNQPVLGSVQITNTWSSTIPAGTVYTYIYAGKQKTFRSPKALARNAVLTINDAAVATTGACQASFPDPTFTISPKLLNNMPNVTLQSSP